jgi:hypothetical protein
VIRGALAHDGGWLGAPVQTLVDVHGLRSSRATIGPDGSGAVAWLRSERSERVRVQARVFGPGLALGAIHGLGHPWHEAGASAPQVASAPGGHILVAWAEAAHQRLVLARAVTP